MNKLSFAIVGGGPAGFYTAKLLAKLPCAPQIHMYQKQVCPFGLIRYGVAPDHISIKRAEMTLSQIQNYQNFHYIGNEPISSTADVEQLRKRYSGVIYSYGASGSTKPKLRLSSKVTNNESDIESNIKTAREIVYWYNKHPDYEERHLNLSNTQTVTIIGNGNVAIDIARIFLRPTSELSQTQISPTALQDLKQSKIHTVSIVGRRGVTQSAFALKQLRELHKCKIKLIAIRQELEASLNEASYYECTALGDHYNNVIRMNKRKTDFIKDNFQIIDQGKLEQYLKDNKNVKKIVFRYLLNPMQLAVNGPDDNKQQYQLSFRRTYLKGEPFKQKSEDTDEIVRLSHDMLIYSTGFQVNDLQGAPYKQNSVPNSNGCITLPDANQQEVVQIGNYVAGWCKTGPQGVIDQTLLGCEQTFNNIRIHYQNGVLHEKPQIKISEVFDLSRNIDFEQYKKVREIELGRGDKQKFIKKKLSTREILEMHGISTSHL